VSLAESTFDLATMLADLRTLEPAGNDPAIVVRLRVACAAMPEEAVAPVLAVLRTLRWNTDTRRVASAFFERWAALAPEAALTASRSTDFGGAIPDTVRAVFQGISGDDPLLTVRLLNTLPDGKGLDDIWRHVAECQLSALSAAELAPLLPRIQSAGVRRYLIDRLLSGSKVLGNFWFAGNAPPPPAADCALLAPACLSLSGRDAMSSTALLAGKWARADEAAVRAWVETLPERSPQQWGALTGLADAVSAKDPAAAIELVKEIPWNSAIRETLQEVAQRWLSKDRKAAQAWLQTADIPPESKKKLLP
jgi:hypothetical protein